MSSTLPKQSVSDEIIMSLNFEIVKESSGVVLVGNLSITWQIHRPAITDNLAYFLIKKEFVILSQIDQQQSHNIQVFCRTGLFTDYGLT